MPDPEYVPTRAEDIGDALDATQMQRERALLKLAALQKRLPRSSDEEKNNA